MTNRRIKDKVMELCGGSVNGKTVVVLGVTFKPETDFMRDAPSLTVVPTLVSKGAKGRVVDLKRLVRIMATPVMADPYIIYVADDVMSCGFTACEGVGRSQGHAA